MRVVQRLNLSPLIEINDGTVRLDYVFEMTVERHLLERAFEIAQSGTCSTVHELRQVLKSDGYARSEIEGHTSGASIKRQLLGLIEASRNSSVPGVRCEHNPPPSGRAIS